MLCLKYNTIFSKILSGVILGLANKTLQRKKKMKKKSILNPIRFLDSLISYADETEQNQNGLCDKSSGALAKLASSWGIKRSARLCIFY